MAKSTVYFTNELTPEAVVKMYRQLGIELPGRVAVKVHSGEDGNQNYLHPEFMKPVIDAVNGTVVECNTAYGGARNETPKHIELMKKHHWSDLFDVDIMDAEGPDVEWPVENGKVLKVNYLGKNIENYDSMLVLIHFKGHPMGGYGGALKQLSIGCASRRTSIPAARSPTSTSCGRTAPSRTPSLKPWQTPPPPWQSTLRARLPMSPS
jgi:uncharacterized Fe-S center protein